MQKSELTADDKKSLTEALSNMDFFKDLKEADLSFVAQHVGLLSAQPGTTLIKQGHKPDALYIVKTGHVVVKTRFWVLSPWKELKTLGPGDFFGEMALVKGGKRSAFVQATEQCEFFVLSQSDFEMMIENNPPFREKLKKLIEERKSAQPSLN